ncbi:MAG TPA: hypothetical protein VMT35_13140 [Ignavibacteriaceae bacterium]|nr:hypothetical protein [Ignavibacteriaceae bacterium]
MASVGWTGYGYRITGCLMDDVRWIMQGAVCWVLDPGFFIKKAKPY